MAKVISFSALVLLVINCTAQVKIGDLDSLTNQIPMNSITFKDGTNIIYDTLIFLPDYGMVRTVFVQKFREGKITTWKNVLEKKPKYFQKHNEPIMPLNYKNLVDAVSDNELMKRELRQLKKYKVMKPVGLILNMVLMASSANKALQKIEEDCLPSFIPSPCQIDNGLIRLSRLFFYYGLTAFTAVIVLSPIREQKLFKRTIEKYNKN